jgi:serine/threonine protein kinase
LGHDALRYTGEGRVSVQRIGRYEIQELIKEGGMGAVYLARDPTIERQVAIKLVKGDLEPWVEPR